MDLVLNRFFEEMQLTDVCASGLTVGRVLDHLRDSGITVDETEPAEQALAGYLFAAGRVGVAFINGDEMLPRDALPAARMSSAIFAALGEWLASVIFGHESSHISRNCRIESNATKGTEANQVAWLNC